MQSITGSISFERWIVIPTYAKSSFGLFKSGREDHDKMGLRACALCKNSKQPAPQLNRSSAFALYLMDRQEYIDASDGPSMIASSGGTDRKSVFAKQNRSSVYSQLLHAASDPVCRSESFFPWAATLILCETLKIILFYPVINIHKY